MNIALLRAVNVGGRGKVAMPALRDLFVSLGFTEVQTLLQTGNVVFRSDAEAGNELERRLEAEAAKQLELRTDFLVRNAEEWARVIGQNPFVDFAERDPSHLLVMFLKDAPSTTSMDALRAAITGREEIHLEARQLYIAYPDGIGRSRLTNSLIEAKLETRGTGRNWNTVLKLAALVGA